MSQTATYNDEMHALHTELANMAQKSELQATLSKGNQGVKGHQGQSPRDLPKLRTPDLIDLCQSPNLKQDHACPRDTCSP